jgi:D-tyrosyl-tRNA(Tyr) deacylase
MRAVLQRVSSAAVTVNGESVGSIGLGFLLLVGFTAGDGEEQIAWVADKVAGLRVFPDDAGRMNLDLRQVGGAALVVSQFTLYADVQKGRRPSFVTAAPPAQAEPLYDRFAEALRERGIPTETGSFGALMHVALVNDGPVTLILER